MKRYILAAISLLVLAACSGADEAPTDLAADAPAVTVTDPYIKPPLAGRDVAAGFFTLSNDGAADRLVAASTPIAQTVEIHTHSEVEGVMAMRQIDGIDIPAGGSVKLKPGSYHLMLFGVELEEGTADAALTLSYASGHEETLSVPIRR